MTAPRRRVLFFCTELAGYLVNAARRFAQLYGVEVHFVQWPVNADAPFTFDLGDWGVIHDRKNFDHLSLIALADRLSPDFVYVAGWVDRGYCRAAKALRRRGIPTVCGMDTQWKGTLRQRVRLAAGAWYVRRCFTHAWAAGAPQVELARRLGFSDRNILLGLYTADVPAFARVYTHTRTGKASSYPHVVMYVGRFSPEKGVQDLYAAFRQLRSQGLTRDWTLRLVGAGKLGAGFTSGDGVSVEGFTSNVPELAVGAGALVLPSRSEAWGVVLHEFAAAGLPLISSDACGARTAYVETLKNGNVFKAGDVPSLMHTLQWLFARSDAELLVMGDRSHELGMALSPDTWAHTAASLMKAHVEE
jgi:glycosyltransferase involved in cell wall biosynthesis